MPKSSVTKRVQKCQAKYRAAGVCTNGCGRPSNGHWKCETCRKKYYAKYREKRNAEWRKSYGLSKENN